MLTANELDGTSGVRLVRGGTEYKVLTVVAVRELTTTIAVGAACAGRQTRRYAVKDRREATDVEEVIFASKLRQRILPSMGVGRYFGCPPELRIVENQADCRDRSPILTRLARDNIEIHCCSYGASIRSAMLGVRS